MMSVSDLFRRRSTADDEQTPVTADSRMDVWARKRGATLVESVVSVTRRDG